MTTDAVGGPGGEDRDACVSENAPQPRDDGPRAETPDELRARLTPPPMSPQYLDGPAWLRSGDTEAEEPATPVQAVNSTSTSPSSDASVVTPRDVSESAMRAVVGIDAAIASLRAMRTQLLTGIGGVAVDDAAAERLDPGVGVRDVACELALQQRRSDRTVEVELNHAMLERRGVQPGPLLPAPSHPQGRAAQPRPQVEGAADPSRRARVRLPHGRDLRR